jgi:FkbM family methyltransferase
VIKTLSLLGQEHTFTSADGDYYLESMAPDGPHDIQQVFSVFCPKNANVIDVGSNIGITAVVAGLLVAPGLVLAMEPVKETFESLARNVDASGLTNIRCFNVAAASTPGQVKLVSRPGHSFAAFVGTDDVLDRFTGYSEEGVAALTLDQLTEDEGLSRVDFIKIDVEGYELEVLRGSARLLQTFQPTVLLEANHYCLNIFRKLSMVDFLEEVLSTFPIVYAVDASLETLDLRPTNHHAVFFHDNLVLGKYQNLLCGFSPSIEQDVARLKPSENLTTAVAQDLSVDQSAPGAEPSNRLADRLRRHVGGFLHTKRSES